MSALDEPSTIQRWHPGGIDLPERRRDPQPGSGILTAAVVGGAVLIWSYVLARALWWWLG